MATSEKRQKPSPTSFSSLPNDITLNILARISRSYYPTLSLVSTSFRALLSSRELDETRTLLEKTEKCFHLLLTFPRPRWFIINQQEKLIPIPPLPYQQHPESPTIVSTGSEVYIIGGYIRKRRSRYVFLLDCRSYRWRRLPDMLFPRVDSAAGLVQGKIYVFGGCYSPSDKNWGEIYDPETGSWELLSNTAVTRPALEFQKSVTRFDCFVGEEKIWCRGSRILNLIWCDLEDDLGWREVKGLEGLARKYSPKFIAVANPDGGRRVSVMWLYKVYRHESGSVFVRHVEIWCAEISLERPSKDEVVGTVEWSKMIYATDDSEISGLDDSLCLAMVTH